jgi:hypothetical protein
MTEITYEPPREPTPTEQLMAAIPAAISAWRRQLDQTAKRPERCAELVALEAAWNRLKEATE